MRKRAVRSIWSLALLVGLLPGCVGPRSPEPVAWHRTTIGLCEDYPEESRTLEHARRDLTMARDSGAQVLRIAFGWDAMERERGKYDWSFWDDFVGAAREAGIRLIPYVCYTPKWAATDPGADYWRSPPRDPADYARFMRAIVARYRGTIQSWELWNEPDNQAYWLGTPRQFADLVKAGAAAVREADPTAQIVLGGIAGEVDFLGKVLVEERVGEVVDIVNFHSYFETWHPNAIEQLPSYIKSVADVVRRTEHSLPLWMAEVGYSSVGDRADVSGVYRAHFRGEHSEASQASALARTTFTALATGELTLFAWYRINDLVPSQEVIGDDNNRHLGLLRRDGSPKPALAMFSRVARLFAGPYDVVSPRVAVPGSSDSRSEVRVFRMPGGRYLVAAWLGMVTVPAREIPKPDTRTATVRVAVPGATARRVAFRDALGRDVLAGAARWRSTREGLELTLTLHGDTVIIAESQ